MRSVIFALCVGALCTLLATGAWAEFDEDDFKEVDARIQSGEGFFAKDSYPDASDHAQFIQFEMRGLAYRIDVRARLCVATSPAYNTIVPCRALKKGYPAIARFITWEKDGWAE